MSRGKKKEYKSNIRMLNLSQYSQPLIIEQKNRSWIGYGADNLYFDYLINSYQSSPTAVACITGISQMIYGRGLDATNSSKKPDEYAQMKSLFTDKCTRKLATDLKLFGMASFQVVYSKDRTRIAEVDHFPVECLRAEKANYEGEIEAYYYMADWADIKPGEEPKRIPAYGFSSEEIEIYYIKPYRPGYFYYSPVDYVGALDYQNLEAEIGTFHINNVRNGMTPGLLMNFNSGIPDEDLQNDIERKILNKYTGTTNAGKIIIAFNDDKDQAATIDAVQLSDAHNQYQFLSEESQSKILVGHRVTSPLLFGIKNTSSGFGSNADELSTSSTLFDNTVIRPFQDLLLTAFDEILAFNDISLNLYFKSLQPLAFVDLENAMSGEEVEEQTGIKEDERKEFKMIDGYDAYKTIEEAEAKANELGCMGYHEHLEPDGTMWYMPCQLHTDLKKPCWDGYEQIGTKMKDGKEVPNCVPLKDQRPYLTDDLKDAILKEYASLGEDEETILEDFELIDSRPANDYDKAINDSLDLATQLAFVPKSTPNKKSEQDTSIIKVRYRYYGSNNPEREFCRDMWAAQKVYRMEDLDKESSANSELAPSGQSTYNLWLYKGGVNCQHYWERRTYLRKNNERITVAEARRKIQALDPSLRDEAKIETNVPEVAQVAAPKNNWWSLQPGYRS